MQISKYKQTFIYTFSLCSMLIVLKRETKKRQCLVQDSEKAAAAGADEPNGITVVLDLLTLNIPSSDKVPRSNGA